MAIDRTPIVLGDATTEVSVVWENEIKDDINNLKANAVDTTDGKVNASQVEIDADATTAGDRSLIMRLTGSLTRILKWVNASSGFVLTDQGGSTLYPLLLADGSNASHAVTKQQLDAAGYRNVVSKTGNYTVLPSDFGLVLSCSGTFTLSLTSASTLGNGWYCYIQNNGTGVITIDPSGTQIMDSLLEVRLGPGNGCLLYTGGAGGFGTIGRKEEYILLQDVKSAGTDGGTFTSGAARTRDLNTEAIDTGNNCSLSSNQFTLQPGTYRIWASAPAFQVGRHQAFLRNITDSVDVLQGTSEATPGAGSTTTRSVIAGQFSITASKAFEIQHRSSSSRSTDGFGLSTSFNQELFTMVELWKVV